ncbi:hypothetical protein [Oceanicola sp. S124]|uniref:hypothetical protein n=1 Tax=Oceanicola sp. S124 TaxID=1042378 RepID=UPI000255A43A|nr:hypothetical protein [Oceanicola sp. S124]
MTETIDFPIEPHATGAGSQCFTLLDGLDGLPESPGLYVLLGRGPGGLRPLGFGHSDCLARVPRGTDFAAALREGFHGVAIARLPRDGDPQQLIRRLGRTHHAPLNIRREALRAIDAASLPQQMPLAAE